MRSMKPEQRYGCIVRAFIAGDLVGAGGETGRETDAVMIDAIARHIIAGDRIAG